MPSKQSKKNRAGGVNKEDVTTARSTDESGRSTRSTVKATEAQRTVSATPNGSQVQPAAIEFNPNTLPEGGAKTGHGTLPTKEAAASASTQADSTSVTAPENNPNDPFTPADEIVNTAEAQRTVAEKRSIASCSSAPSSSEDGGMRTAPTDDDKSTTSSAGTVPTDDEMEDVSMEKTENRTRNAVLDAQLQAAKEDASRCQEQKKYAEAKMAEAQCKIAELEVQLQEAKDKVAVLQEFRQSRSEVETIKSKRSSRRGFGAAKALHCVSRNRPDAVASSKEKPASDSVGVTVGYIMTATPHRDRRNSRGRQDGSRKTIGPSTSSAASHAKLYELFMVMGTSTRSRPHLRTSSRYNNTRLDGSRFSRTFGANNFVAKDIRARNSCCAIAMNTARGAPLVEEGVPLSSADVSTFMNNNAETIFGRPSRLRRFLIPTLHICIV